MESKGEGKANEGSGGESQTAGKRREKKHWHVFRDNKYMHVRKRERAGYFQPVVVMETEASLLMQTFSAHRCSALESD